MHAYLLKMGPAGTFSSKNRRLRPRLLAQPAALDSIQRDLAALGNAGKHFLCIQHSILHRLGCDGD
jgi:hypothetical protein